jgi:hypothetical protein
LINQDNYQIPISSLAKNDKLIEKMLSEHLYDGKLALALGAGVSTFLGFPVWWELVNRICVEHNGTSSINENTSPDELKNTVDEIERDVNNHNKFSNLVKRILYKDVDYLNDTNVIQNKLLISLGALMMGSRRGSVNNVITYNFDNVLEWYLGLHGFNAKVIYDPRTMTTNSDVTIYHPNGFLPLQDNIRVSTKLIFSKTSFIYREREVTVDDKLWENILDRLFIEKMFIFIGLSGTDQTINSRLLDIYENQLNRKRPVGYWFYIREDGMEIKETRNILKYGIVPIVVKNKDDIPRYLLNICQDAIARI